MKRKIIKYSNDDITVVWNPEVCIHAGECVKGLPDVFKPNDKPWVNVNNASAEELKRVIDKCPSGALSYESSEKEENGGFSPAVEIKMLKNGPFLVEGNFTLTSSDGETLETRSKIALCRCGASGNKPFCDGTHNKIGFAD